MEERSCASCLQENEGSVLVSVCLLCLVKQADRLKKVTDILEHFGAPVWEDQSE
jgi:hypothetical protein